MATNSANNNKDKDAWLNHGYQQNYQQNYQQYILQEIRIRTDNTVKDTNKSPVILGTNRMRLLCMFADIKCHTNVGFAIQMELGWIWFHSSQRIRFTLISSPCKGETTNRISMDTPFAWDAEIKEH